MVPGSAYINLHEVDVKDPVELRPQLQHLIFAAFDEAAAAILERLGTGKRPSRVHRYPSYSLRDNGMPSLDDGTWAGGGPLEYSSLLDPPYGDEEARKLGKFPPEKFPAIAALVAFTRQHPEIARMRPEVDVHADLFTRIGIELLISRAVDQAILSFGEAAIVSSKRDQILAPVLNALFQERLELAVLAPVAFVRFEFDRMRIGPGVFMLRMSPDLQRARWKAKAHGLAGHDHVLASATHTLVLTGWEIDNREMFDVYNALSVFHPSARDTVDAFFAALRIATGVETGYAQELHLSRGWRHRHDYGLPDVHAGGARRYPEHFDDFGWNRADMPIVSRHAMREVPRLFAALKAPGSDRLSLATRRLNSAMTRGDAADAILDATIALEILLGDGDSQAINWKLRMRGAALVALDSGHAAGEAMHISIGKIYAARSAIVHGGRRRNDTLDDADARNMAIGTLRTILRIITRRSEYLDVHKIDCALLRAPPADHDQVTGAANT